MTRVRRRCVFYLGGFDPKGAPHYHALFRQQAALQQSAGGPLLEVGERRKLPSGNSCWTVRAVDDGGPVETHYEFMRWDDIVRAHWPRHAAQLWRDVIVTTLFYLRTGALWKMFRLSWPPVVALVVPFLLAVAVLTLVPLVSVGTAFLALRTTGSGWAAAACGLGAALPLLLAAVGAESRWNMAWMMRSYAFTRLQATGRVPALEARLDAFAEQLAHRLREGVDHEVLVVGHSSGAILACAVVARALKRLPDRPESAELSLLTLGQWIPLLGTVPSAQRFRRELAVLATHPRLAWVDFSAPPDGCCFALSDPIQGCGLHVPARLPDRPKLLSPRFSAMFDPADYRALRADRLRLHFQYLMASAHDSGYDYFRITAGAKTLERRFRRNPSVIDFERLRPPLVRRKP